MPLTVAIQAQPDRADALRTLVAELGLTVTAPGRLADVVIADTSDAAVPGQIGLVGAVPLAAVRACLVELADQAAALDVLRFTAARVDLSRGRLIRDGQMTPLRAKEVALLRALAQRAGRAVPRAVLLQEVWGYGAGVRTRTLDTTIARIRGHLEPDRRQPVHLLTVHGVGYRLDPLPAQLTAGGGLPTDSPALIGREVELAAITRAFTGEARWVGLIGLGGVGKSALAVAAARRSAPTYPGGTWWVRLSEPGVEGFVSAVATTLDVPLLPAVDPVTHLGAALARRSTMLLVLDGAEAALEVVAAVVPRWLAVAPNLRVLTTSRQATGAPGERRLTLDPLEPHSAAAVLRARLEARGVRQPGDDELAALVQRTGGIPLALVLVADRVAQRGARAALAQLPMADRVVDGRTDEPAALAAVLQLTWGSLPPDQRARLVRIAPFVGPIDWETLLALEPDPIGVPLTDRVQALHDRGVLALADDLGRRFVMPDPVRHFVRRQGGRAAADARHAAVCLQRCRRDLVHIDGTAGEAALDGLLPLRPELRAAARRTAHAGIGLGAALAWGMLTVRRGPWTGLADHIEQALARWGDREAPRLAAQLLQVRTIAGLVTVQVPEAMDAARRARAVMDRVADVEDPRSDGLAIPIADVRALVDGCEAQALARLMPAHAHPFIAAWLTRASTPLEHGLAMLARGILHGAELRWPEGASDLGVAADALARAGRHRHASIAACDRIYYLAQAGELQPALDLAERTQATARVVLGPVLAAFITQNRALTLLALERNRAADTAFQRAADRFTELDMQGPRRAALIGRGFVALLDGALGLADARFSEAEARADRHRGRALAGRACVAALRGDAQRGPALAQLARAAGGFPAHVVQGAAQLAQAAEHILDPHGAPAPQPKGLDGRLAQRIVARAGPQTSEARR